MKIYRYITNLCLIIVLLIGANISIADQGENVKNLSVSNVKLILPQKIEISHGMAANELGVVLAKPESPMQGATDFSVDTDGRIIILDKINSKLLKLSGALKFEEAIKLTDKSIDSLHFENGHLHLKSATTEQYYMMNPEGKIIKTSKKQDKSDFWIRSKKYSPREFLIRGYNKDKSNPLFSWRLNFEQDVLAVYPLSQKIHNNKLYFRIDYLVSKSPLKLESSVIVVDISGLVLAKINLQSTGEARLKHDTKIGADGSIVQLRIVSDKTEVIKWLVN